MADSEPALPLAGGSRTSPPPVWSPSPSSAVAPPSRVGADEAPLRVACRVRPLAAGEHDYCLRVRGSLTVSVLPSLASLATAAAADDPTQGDDDDGGAAVNAAEATHKLDHAFGPQASQYEVFKAAQPLVAAAVGRGANAAVVCCGPAGSGKTHTLVGEQANPGLMARAVTEAFRLAHDPSTFNAALLERSLLDQPNSGRRQVRL